MMFSLRKSLPQRVAILCLLASLPFVATTTKVQAADFDKPVFDFQSKLASQGNAEAQYYLAQMYEEGRGTEANAEKAQHWYDQAKLNGYDPNKLASSGN